MSKKTALDVQAINEIALGTKRLMAAVDGIIAKQDINDQEHGMFREFMTKQEQVNSHLATSITLRRSEQKRARTKVGLRVFNLLNLQKKKNTWGNREHEDYMACFGIIRARIYKGIYEKFDVSSYIDIPSIDAEKLYEYIDNWYPTESLNDIKSWCYKQAEAKRQKRKINFWCNGNEG